MEFFLHTQKSLSNQGRKELFNLYNKIHDDCFNHETLMSLLDTYISCILSYEYETWVHRKVKILKRYI